MELWPFSDPWDRITYFDLLLINLTPSSIFWKPSTQSLALPKVKMFGEGRRAGTIPPFVLLALNPSKMAKGPRNNSLSFTKLRPEFLNAHRVLGLDASSLRWASTRAWGILAKNKCRNRVQYLPFGDFTVVFLKMVFLLGFFLASRSA